MISALTGNLTRVDENAVQITCAPFVFDLSVPAADVEGLRGRVGEEITFHTLFYLEGSAGGGNLDPRLIGFLRPEDKRFFNLFTTVKGIGPKTALRALSAPVGEIAQAIESKDARFLVGLDGIGKRTAELIIAELSGKLKDFAVAHVGEQVKAYAAQRALSADEEDALSAMTALGEKRADAERLLQRVKQLQPHTKSTDALLREMLRLRG